MHEKDTPLNYFIYIYIKTSCFIKYKQILIWERVFWFRLFELTILYQINIICIFLILFIIIFITFILTNKNVHLWIKTTVTPIVSSFVYADTDTSKQDFKNIVSTFRLIVSIQNVIILFNFYKLLNPIHTQWFRI